MSTYADKIRKYEARIQAMVALGLEPREKDVARYVYYVGRAEKKGLSHETGVKDAVHGARGRAKRAAKWLWKNR